MSESIKYSPTLPLSPNKFLDGECFLPRCSFSPFYFSFLLLVKMFFVTRHPIASERVSQLWISGQVDSNPFFFFFFFYRVSVTYPPFDASISFFMSTILVLHKLRHGFFCVTNKGCFSAPLVRRLFSRFHAIPGPSGVPFLPHIQSSTPPPPRVVTVVLTDSFFRRLPGGFGSFEKTIQFPRVIGVGARLFFLLSGDAPFIVPPPTFEVDY